jgi:antitoxin component YwqK of YwqJK toxin-antitoxin module
VERVIARAAALLLAAPALAAAGDLSCPPGASLLGAGPPGGSEVWCARPDVAGKPVRQGPSRAYYDDGSIRVEAIWKDGRLDGAFVEYHRGGVVAQRGAYRDGERQGPWVFNYASGTREEEIEFDRGRRNGRFTSYHPNGRKKTEGRFCFGLQCGRWTSWDESGSEIGSATYEEIRGNP